MENAQAQEFEAARGRQPPGVIDIAIKFAVEGAETAGAGPEDLLTAAVRFPLRRGCQIGLGGARCLRGYWKRHIWNRFSKCRSPWRWNY